MGLKKPIWCFIFQINGMIVATLSHDQMIEILRKPGSVSAVIVPPFQSGKPRKYVSFISDLRSVVSKLRRLTDEHPFGSKVNRASVRQFFPFGCLIYPRGWPSVPLFRSSSIHLALILKRCLSHETPPPPWGLAFTLGYILTYLSSLSPGVSSLSEVLIGAVTEPQLLQCLHLAVRPQ